MIHVGDALTVLQTMPAESVQCVVTSPPYWGLRDYGTATWAGGDPDCTHLPPDTVLEEQFGRASTLVGSTTHQKQTAVARYHCKCGATRTDSQLGLEATPQEYVAHMVEVFREVRRVLRKDGTLWLNLGSSYASGDSGPSRSREPGRDPAYGSDGTAPSDSTGLDSACLDLCDGCQAAIQSHHDRTPGSDQPPGPTVPPVARTVRGSGHPGSESASLDASPPASRESTTGESSPQPRGECLHCANCGACLSVLRSSSRDARLCVRKESYMHGTAAPSSGGHSRDRGDGGLAWVNYTRTLKPKDMVPIPWMVAMALQAGGWYLRSDIIWNKPNPMPESVTDRPTKAHEYLFLLTRSATYYYDAAAIAEVAGQPTGLAMLTGQHKAAILGHTASRTSTLGSNQGDSGRNKRTVWTISTQPYPGAHFATFPEALVEPCIKAGSRPGDLVLDPFAGSGTTLAVAKRLDRDWVGIELNPAYAALAEKRLEKSARQIALDMSA